MKVVHVVPALFGDDGVYGGAERYVYELAKQMANVVETKLVAFGPQDRTETEGKLQIRVIGNPHYVKGQRSNPISRKIFREFQGADVIHCHQQHILQSSLNAIFGGITRKTVCVTDLGGGGWDISGYLSTDRLYAAHLHISEYSRKVFGHDHKPWAHVILGGIDTERFHPGASQKHSNSALYVGRLVPHKGIDYLIQGLPTDMTLEVIGRPYDDAYAKKLHEISNGRKVRFREDCSDDDIIKAYQSAACIVLPSVYKTEDGQTTAVPELLGQTALEGMACGTPAICTNVASLPEIVMHEETGFLVPPNNAGAIGERLKWFMTNPKQAQSMGDAARQSILDRFTWPKVVGRCLSIYEEAARS